MVVVVVVVVVHHTHDRHVTGTLVEESGETPSGNWNCDEFGEV
jgi:hypothetical protein